MVFAGFRLSSPEAARRLKRDRQHRLSGTGRLQREHRRGGGCAPAGDGGVLREPAGMTTHPNIKTATSLIDFVFRVLGMEYLGRTDFVHVKPADDEIEEEEQIQGAPPSLINLPPGCPFSPRCPLVEDTCNQVEPDLTSTARPQHQAACHRWQQVAAMEDPTAMFRQEATSE